MKKLLLLLLLVQDETFRLPDGFSIELVAREPDIVDPIAMAFDEDGRLYVVEMNDYPLGPPGGRVKLLIDSDGDGRFDRTTVFADQLPFPTGLAPWNGGVIVSAAPDIWFFKDRDGDGKADERRVLFTGFGRGNQQHRLNGFAYGLDNWFYGANGDSGGRINGVALAGCDFRFRPDTGEFETTSGQSQFAQTFDDWGNRFSNNSGNHLIYSVIPQRYLKRNPHLRLPHIQIGIADHHALFPISDLRGVFMNNATAAKPNFTAACSVTIYRGGAFPSEYHGAAFTCDPVMNLVHIDRITPQGAVFAARRMHKDCEFLASSDLWFRPVNFAHGPDGALYVADMYRGVIEHPQWIPKAVQEKTHLRAGDDKGRIYRIVHESMPPSPKPCLSRASVEELVSHLDSPNAWWRLTAQRLLVERKDKRMMPFLRDMARNGSALGRLHAFWLLAEFGEISEAALSDPEPGIRENALKVYVGPKMLELVGDPNPRVRFQLALALGDWKDERAIPALARLLNEDPWQRAAVYTSIREPAKVLALLPEEFAGKLDAVREMADLVGNSRDEAQLKAWLDVVLRGKPAPWRLSAISGLGPSLKRWGKTIEAPWLDELQAMAFDSTRGVEERVSAIAFLGLIPTRAEKLEALLKPEEPAEIQVAAARAIGGGKLLDRWSSFTTPVRRELLRTLFAKPSGVDRVVDYLQKGEIKPTDLEAHQRALLMNDERVEKLFKESDWEEFGKKALAAPGDKDRGLKVYQSHCSSCHAFRGQGHRVGPDLESVARRDKSALILDILSPSRAIDPAYKVHVVKTTSNETYSGIIAAETPNSITLRRVLGDETTILRRDISKMEAWPSSMMPEGFDSVLSAQDLADLLESLR